MEAAATGTPRRKNGGGGGGMAGVVELRQRGATKVAGAVVVADYQRGGSCGNGGRLG